MTLMGDKMIYEYFSSSNTLMEMFKSGGSLSYLIIRPKESSIISSFPPDIPQDKAVRIPQT
jgi:hypothetical protein